MKWRAKVSDDKIIVTRGDATPADVCETHTYTDVTATVDFDTEGNPIGFGVLGDVEIEGGVADVLKNILIEIEEAKGGGSSARIIALGNIKGIAEHALEATS